MGVDLFKHKLLSFFISSFWAGVGGGLLASLLTTIDPVQFKFTLTFQVLLMVVLGGWARCQVQSWLPGRYLSNGVFEGGRRDALLWVFHDNRDSRPQDGNFLAGLVVWLSGIQKGSWEIAS